MAITKVVATTAATKLAIKTKSAYSLPDRPTDSGYKADTVRDRLFKPITDTTNSVQSELDRIVAAVNAALTEQDGSNAAKVNISVITGASAETPTIATNIPSVNKLIEYVAAEVAKILAGTYPITALVVNGDGTFTGSVTITTNLTVLGQSNLVALTITGDNVDVNGNKVVNMAAGTDPTDAANVGQVFLASNIDTDSTMAADSDTKVPSQKATKAALALKQSTSAKNQANGYAGLGSTGKIASSQMPASAITDTFVVADEAAMLALTTAEKGDVAVRQDLNKSFILQDDPYSTVENWVELLTPTDTVLSVNGEVGAVQIDAPDIPYSGAGSGLSATEVEGAIDETVARVQTLESNDTIQDADIAQAKADATAAAAAIAALITNANGSEMMSRYQPTGELTKASPTATQASPSANLNRVKAKGQTFINLIKGGNAISTANWTVAPGTFNVKDNVANVLVSAQYGLFTQSVGVVQGNVYFFKITLKNTSTSVRIYLERFGLTGDRITPTYGDGTFHTYSYVYTAASTGAAPFGIQDIRSSAWDAFYVKDVSFFNLTALGTHSSGVHWHDMSAATVETYLRELNPAGTTAGIHSTSVDEIRLSDSAPNQAEVEIIRARTVKESLFNPDFAAALSAADWVATDCGTPTVGSSKITLTATAQNGGIAQTLTVVSGNKWHISALVKASSANVKLVGTNPTASAAHSGGGAFELLSFIVTANSTTLVVSLQDQNASGWSAVECYWIQAIPLTGLGLAHFTLPSQVEDYFTISTATLTCYAHGLTNSKPTALAVYNVSNVLQRTYPIASSEWPSAQQTYGMPTLPNGVGDYIDGKAKIYWRNVGINNFNGATESTWAAGTAGTNTYYFNLPSWITNSTCVSADTQTALASRFIQANLAAIDTEGFMINSNTIYVRILKTKVDAMAGATTLDKFKAWLAANNLLVFYARTATDHALTATTMDFRITAISTDYASLTGALNPLTASVLSTRYTTYADFGTVGALNSLPDGTFDQYENAVDIDPQSATFQERVSEKIAISKKIDLPTTAGLWQIGKVGTATTRFFLILDSLLSQTIVARATAVFRANLPTASGWDNITTNTYSCPLTTGLETWAGTVVPTIYIKGAPFGKVLGKYEDFDTSTEGIYLDATSENLIIYTVDAGDLAGLYTELASNPLSVVIPYDTYGASLDNAYTFNAGVLDDFIATTADTPLCTFYYDLDNADTYFSLKLPNATADTLAELYTYLAANPITLVVPIVSATTAPVVGYVKQVGANAMTLTVTSSTASLPADFEATYCKDLNAVLAAL